MDMAWLCWNLLDLVFLNVSELFMFWVLKRAVLLSRSKPSLAILRSSAELLCVYIYIYMCVCVKHLNRCKTCTLFVAGEWSRPAEHHLTKLSAVSWGYHWRRPVTYLHSCDYLLFRVCFPCHFIFVLCNQCVWMARTGQSFYGFFMFFHHAAYLGFWSCTFATIWYFFGGDDYFYLWVGATQTVMWLSRLWRWLLPQLIWYFFGVYWNLRGKGQLPISNFFYSDQVYWSVFARPMHSTSQFDKKKVWASVCLCVCVLVLGFSMF